MCFLMDISRWNLLRYVPYPWSNFAWVWCNNIKINKTSIFNLYLSVVCKFVSMEFGDKIKNDIIVTYATLQF